jgi:hypothetical protein
MEMQPQTVGEGEDEVLEEKKVAKIGIFLKYEKLFGTNEYRGLNSVERAILFQEKEGISLPKADEICSIHFDLSK